MANKCILVIDDEADIHTVAQIGLTLKTGWKVLTASSGAEGVEIALKQQPDAILLDAMMPQQGGIETLIVLLVLRLPGALPESTPVPHLDDQAAGEVVLEPLPAAGIERVLQAPL